MLGQLGIVKLAATLVAVYYLESYGRKNILQTGVMIVALGMVSCYFFLF